ncbi:MAG: hypothetical protein ACHQFW_00415 [Chitinophagales bacterium]
MKINIVSGLLIFLFTAILISCNKDKTAFNDIHFVFQFEEGQERLDNFGDPSVIPAGNAAQTPLMNLLSVHYIEMTQNEFIPFKEGAILYSSVETSDGGENAIDFDSSHVSGEGVDFIKIRLDRLPAGTYNYVRASVAFQNFDVQYNVNNIPGFGNLSGQSGTLASFIGYRTYIRDLTIKNLTTTINENKVQGFWGFETLFTDALAPYNAIYTGQAPAGSTTVVNPLDATSPIPAGSCVITGKFVDPLVITGDETSELFITMSFSINQSFEWTDLNANGEWDIDATTPANNEPVVDMGLRGMIPLWEWKD